MTLTRATGQGTRLHDVPHAIDRWQGKGLVGIPGVSKY